MAYIGRVPQVGNYFTLDAITASSTATYNLLKGGVAYVPETAYHLIVSLNGVIQAPITAFTVSGSTITFASTLSASDSIDFITVLGDTLAIGTPSDGTVTNAKIVDVAATKLTGSIADARVPASAVTQHVTPTDLTPVRQDILTLGLKQAIQENSTKFNLPNSAITKFEADADYDSSGSTTISRNVNEYLEAIAASGLTVSKVGSPTHSTSQSTSWSTSSMALDASNRLYIDGGADGVFDILPLGGGGNMTVEVMMYYTDTTSWKRVCGVDVTDYGASGGAEYIDLHGQTGTNHYYRNAGTNTPSGGGWTSSQYAVSTSAWHHLAVVCEGSAQAFYVDGTRQDTNSNGAGSGGVINLRYAFPTGARAGYFDNFRVSNVARYSGASFTAPTDHFTNDSNTLCLVQSIDQADASTTFTDEGTANSSVSATGTALGTTNVPTSAVTDVSGVMLLKNEHGTNTLGTDVKVYFTANNSAWTEAASYTDAGTFSTGIKMIKLGKTTCTSGSDVRWKVVFANQAASSKVANIYGIGINY